MRIWWMMHFFKFAYKCFSLSNMQPVSRCIVMQKQGYMGQLSSVLLFSCNAQFLKQVGTVDPCNRHFVWHIVNQQYTMSIPENCTLSYQLVPAPLAYGDMQNRQASTATMRCINMSQFDCISFKFSFDAVLHFLVRQSGDPSCTYLCHKQVFMQDRLN